MKSCAALPDFPPRLRALVEHMIISHHGQLEFGSPKIPQFPEALLLHYLDDMDSKMECMRSMLAKDRHVDGCFTGYSAALDRTVLKKDRFLAGPPAPKPKPAAPPVHSETTAPAAPAVQPAAVAAPERAVHPLFAPKSSSAFADKLQQALQPATAKQEE